MTNYYDYHEGLMFLLAEMVASNPVFVETNPTQPFYVPEV